MIIVQYLQGDYQLKRKVLGQTELGRRSIPKRNGLGSNTIHEDIGPSNGFSSSNAFSNLSIDILPHQSFQEWRGIPTAGRSCPTARVELCDTTAFGWPSAKCR